MIKMHKIRLVSSMIFALLVWVIGMIVIVLSLLLIFFNNWPALSNLYACPSTWTISYLTKINIIQIIYTVMIGLYTLLMFILSAVFLYHQLNLKQVWHLSHRFQAIYPLFIFVGKVCGIISILYSIKVYLSIADVSWLYRNNSLGQACIKQKEVQNMQQKKTILIIVISFIFLMLFLTVLLYCSLPYSYLKRKQQNYEQRQPLRYKVKQVKQKLRLNQRLSDSNQELLIHSQIKQKQFQSTGINVDLPQEKVNENLKKCFEIGVNANIEVQLPKKVLKQMAVNSVNPMLIQTACGNHVFQSSYATDCAHLNSQQQQSELRSDVTKRTLEKTERIKLKQPSRIQSSDGSDAMVIVQPELYGYYYLQRQKELQESESGSFVKDYGQKKAMIVSDRSKYFISSIKSNKVQQSQRYIYESEKSGRSMLRKSRNKAKQKQKAKRNTLPYMMHDYQ